MSAANGSLTKRGLLGKNTHPTALTPRSTHANAVSTRVRPHTLTWGLNDSVGSLIILKSFGGATPRCQKGFDEGYRVRGFYEAFADEKIVYP